MYLFETDLAGLRSSCLPLAGQLVLQVSDLRLQQLNDFLVVLLSAAGLPLPHFSLGCLKTTFQTHILLNSQTGFLGKDNRTFHCEYNQCELLHPHLDLHTVSWLTSDAFCNSSSRDFLLCSMSFSITCQERQHMKSRWSHQVSLRSQTPPPPLFKINTVSVCVHLQLLHLGLQLLHLRLKLLHLLTAVAAFGFICLHTQILQD